MLTTRKKSRASSTTFNKLFSSKKAGGLFTLAFAITGGVLLLLTTKADSLTYVTDPIHHAQCVQVTPSKTVLRPGESFTGIVKLNNNGTSTFAPSYGFYLDELRTGGRIWNPSGINLASNVGPGGTAQFNLSLRAPSTSGVYSFDWAITIALNGFVHDPCYGPAITVTNPPGITVLANNANSDISVTKGAGLNIAWSASNNPTFCGASGTWSGGKTASGSEDRKSDTSSSGTKTYTLNCSNGTGSTTVTRTVTVNDPPTPPSSPPPSSGGGAPAGSGSKPATNSTGKSNNGSTRSSTQTTMNTDQPAAPPAPPDIFSSSNVNDSTVRLTWKNPDYPSGLSGYELQRSTDNIDWQKVGKNDSTEETFDDTAINFNTTYFYRIRIYGVNGMKSDFAQTQITTQDFKANVQSDDTTLTSQDSLVTVVIPKGAIDQDASCNLQTNNDALPPTKNKYVIVSGPYEILCKAKDGSVIKSFKSAVTVSINVKKGGYGSFSFFVLGDSWQETPTKPVKSVVKIQLTDQTTFALLGKKNSIAIYVKIIVILIALTGTVFGSLFLLRAFAARKERKKVEALKEDYFRKENGIN